MFGLYYFAFSVLILSAQGDDDADEAVYEAVGKMLAAKQHNRNEPGEQLKWLPNSNKIALGYDPVAGEPRCFDGECVMNGFKQPIFDLVYTKVQEGACRDKFIPEFVHYNCIPSTDYQSRTEEISNFRQLSESLGKGASWQIGFGNAAGGGSNNESPPLASQDSRPLAPQGRAIAAAGGALWGMVGAGGMGGAALGPYGALLGASRPSASLGRRTDPGTGPDLGSGATNAVLGSFGMSFGGSSQTRSMINDLYIKNLTIYFTTLTVTTAKLSLYEPRANLSFEFRDVIKRMPCCNQSSRTQQRYVRDYILNYFGTTFLTSILLGGVAQQKVTIKNSKADSLRDSGQSSSSLANFNFQSVFSFGHSSNSGQNDSNLSTFRNSITSSRSTTLGGAVLNAGQNFTDWPQTVESNPTVTMFTLSSIFNLLTNESNRFPNTKDIDSRADYIAFVLESDLNATQVYCENDCTSPQHGICEYTGFFMYGFCKCFPPWSGVDCSVINRNLTTTSTTRRFK